MNISEYSVKNSLVVNALSVFLVLIGIFALISIEREAFPNFSFDIVTVHTDYPGASPDVIEKRITIPLEREIKEVDDIDEMGSVSLEGLSLLILKINPDAPDKARVITDIQRAVEEAENLPEDLRDDPKVKELQVRNTPLVEVSLSGEMDESTLRQLALNLETVLLDEVDIASIERKGMRDPEIWVEVDPAKINQYQMSLGQVMNALAAHNVNIPGGLLKSTRNERIIRTSGELETIDDVKKVIVRSNDEGDGIKVGDISTVRHSFEELKVLNRTDGSRAINLLIIKKDKADAIRLMAKVEQIIADFKESNTPALNIALVNDVSYYIKRRLKVLTSNGWIGLILVMIPIVYFLSTSVALGAAMGMPIALLTAFAAMNFFGISINLISMFGLIMVLGMLVDEDLVVAENIARHLENGLSYREAAIRGSSEVAKAVISVVLTTIIAFLPLLFMTGIFGKFISDIPKVVMVTLAASLIEALVILPSHISDLSKPRHAGQSSSYKKRKSHDIFNRVQARYLKSIKFCLMHPYKTSGIALGITTIAFLWAIFGMRFILFPAKGIESFFLRAETEIGSSLEATEKLIVPLEKFIRQLPEEELEHYVTQIGIMQNDPGDPFTSRGSHLAQIQVFLSPETEREREADTIMAALRPQLESIKGFQKLSIDPVRPGPPVGKPVAVRIRGDDFLVLNEIAETFKSTLKDYEGVFDVKDDYEAGKGELLVDVDVNAAYRAGLTYRDIALTVRQAFEGMPATLIRKADEEIDVVVRLPENARYNQEELTRLKILNQRGNLVSLDKVAELKSSPGVGLIRHFDGKRVVTVTANINEEITTAIEVNRKLEKAFQDLPPQYPGYTITYGGEAEDTQESMQSLLRAFMAAAVLIFLILLITFESLTQTLVVMLAIPFGFVGVILGFTTLGEPFTFLSMLGIVGLSGIVVDTGILLFIFVNQRRKEGESLQESIAQACSIRLRPIFLTTLTTFLGVVPAAYGIGGSDPFIRPMALAMNWGLAVSMFFTLYAMPCVYFIAETWMMWLKSKLK